MAIRHWRIVFLLAALCLSARLPRAEAADPRDEEFDEFAEFDEDDQAGEGAFEVAEEEDDGPEASPPAAGGRQENGEETFDDEEEEEAIVEEEDSEFSHFKDDEEFENYKTDEEEDDEAEFVRGRGAKTERNRRSKPSSSPPPPPKTIHITKVPAHLRNNWENYYLEMLMVAGIVVYFLNFFTGKAKNQRLATAWFNAHRSLLEANFALVGDDGFSKDAEDVETPLQKESENLFTLWCSGRTCCEGMLVELKLLKRQDLVSVIANLLKPGAARDQVRIKVNMNPEDMDPFVYCLAHKKTAAKLAKEMADLNTYCPERRPAVLDKSASPAVSNYCIMSEIPEVTSAMLDSKMLAILTKFPDAVDSVHFSDQFTGPKPPDDQSPAELQSGKKVLLFTFNINTDQGISPDEAAENMKPLLMLVFYSMEKIRRYRLSREAKAKADKNRSKVSEAFWRSIHAAKAERAQEERERKRRELKERIRDIEDPDKQRKMEDRELRRERKKAAPKMKQLKVKAM